MFTYVSGFSQNSRKVTIHSKENNVSICKGGGGGGGYRTPLCECLKHPLYLQLAQV